MQEQYRARKSVIPNLSRREFAAGALALGTSAAIALGAANTQLSVRAQTPASPEAVADLDTIDQAYPLTDEPVTFRILCVSNPRVENMETNTFTQWYEEQTNVHLEWEVVPEQEALTSLNVRLASGDYPDIIMGFNLDPALQLLYGSQGVFLALNDFIDQYGVETKQVFEAEPLAREISTAPDGSIYSLAQVAGCFHCQRQRKLWIYQPWLDALGLQMPATTEEFAEVLRAFKEQDPNGNGEADEIPLLGATGGANPLDYYFMNSFIFDPGGKRLILQEDAVTAIYTTEQWRQGVAYLAGLYAEGLIGSETFTQDQDQLRQVTNAPDAVVVGAVPALAPSAFMDISQEEGARWAGYVTVPPLEGPDGVRIGVYNPYLQFRTGNFLITSACEHPDVAFRWADGLYDIETTLRAVEGVPGEHWRWAEEDEIGNNGEPAIWDRMFNYGQVQNFSWSQSSTYYRPELVHSGQVTDPAEAEFTMEYILYRETRDNYVPYSQPEEWVLPPLYFTEGQAQQVAELDAAITAYVDETFAFAVTGQLDIEAEWETYLATLEGMGLAQYLQLHQEAYDAWRG